MNVFGNPSEVKVPVMDFSDMAQYDKDCDLYALNLKKFVQESMGYSGPLTGRIIHVPHADGAAQYMIADYPREVCLVHMPIGDAWDSPLAHKLNKKEVVDMLRIQDCRPEIPTMEFK